MTQASEPNPQLRALPAVQRLLDEPQLLKAAGTWGRTAVVDATRKALAEARAKIQAGLGTPPIQELIDRVEKLARASLTGGVQRVINATGVILHTGLGRALLAESVIQDIAAELHGYANVEMDLETGNRGERDMHLAEMFCQLLNCEAATAVNNNAAATMLVLSALANGKEVIVSRGQLIEIGGAFRLPDVMALSGAKMVEVGCTNRTHLRDYERAITPETGLLMLAHTSNYRVIGFTKSVEIGELAELGRKHQIPVFHDVGSGCLFRDLAPELKDEPVVSESLAAGADVIAFSGDKIMSGPQSGVIVGRRDLLQRIRKHPLWRALRLDKLILRALQSTVALYFDPETRSESVPTLRLLRRPLAELQREAQTFVERIQAAGTGLVVDTAPDTSRMGSGSLPEYDLPTCAVRLSHPTLNASELTDLLRRGTPPIIVRVQDDHVLIDPRTLLPGESDEIVKVLREVVRA